MKGWVALTDPLHRDLPSISNAPPDLGFIRKWEGLGQERPFRRGSAYPHADEATLRAG
jgi:hypothetical protein